MRAPSLKPVPEISTYINIVYITYFSLEGQTLNTHRAPKFPLLLPPLTPATQTIPYGAAHTYMIKTKLQKLWTTNLPVGSGCQRWIPGKEIYSAR